MGTIVIGTSGYAFDDWTGTLDPGQGALWTGLEPVAPASYPFYPRGTKDKLAFYAAHFPCVEINATYYATPRVRDVESWVARTPPGFTFWVKVPGDVTHRGDLRALAPFVEAMAPLAASGKLAGVLAQFPSAFRPGAAALRVLEGVASSLPTWPIAIEFRHVTWDTPETLRFLERHDLALVAVDAPRLAELFPSRPMAITPGVTQRRAAGGSVLGYLRLHSRDASRWYSGEAARYDYLYSQTELEEWVPWLRTRAHAGDGSVYVFFNNCQRGQAAANARQLAALLAHPQT